MVSVGSFSLLNKLILTKAFSIYWGMCLIFMLPNQTWVHSPECCKANLWTPGCGEGKWGIYCRAPSKESRQLMLKRLKLPNGFQGKVFKDRVREGSCGVHDQLVDILLIGWW